MSKTGMAVVAVLIIAAIAFYVWLQTPIKPPPNGKQLIITVTITLEGGSCLINPMPVSIASGDTVTWVQEQKLPFTLGFSKAIAFNTGSPFWDSTAGKWQLNFDSNNSSTGPAQLTNAEKLFGIDDFNLQTVTVNGQSCYDKSTNPNPNMKVHVN